MEGRHHANWSSVIYREGAVNRTETETPFLPGKDFNTNLIHFLPPHHVIISNMHCVCFLTSTISYVHGSAPKMVLHAQNLVQGSTNLIFTCTDFCAHKMVSRARSCTQNYVCIKSHVGTNLHGLVYNVLLNIVFPIYYAIS